MCVIHIRVQCSDRFSELLVGDVQDAELTVESIVGTALLEVFDTVHIEDVTLVAPKGNDTHEDRSSIVPSTTILGD